LKCFPPPAAEPVDGVARMANDLVQPPDGDSRPAARAARGRPPLDWTTFHVEVARRIKEDTLPIKQEAGIAEMQEWCKARWHHDVGRSTVLQKLKPYYDAFLRQSQKPDK
jgi:hypothetical protein